MAALAAAGDAPAAPAGPSVVNINVGVLGHVDSGKTSLVRALSTKLSTASLDKHPQSKERGITLDLGFSAFLRPIPEHLRAGCPFTEVQYTLVDCPGHASLIRTIIGGAHIIDRMLLVVDVTKGIQTQTAECLVIGEILTDDLTVVLNKVDLIPEAQREERVAKVKETINNVLAATRFKGSPVLSVSAIVGGDGKAGVGENAANQDLDAHGSAAAAAAAVAAAPTATATGVAASGVQSLGLEDLVAHIEKTTTLPDRGDVSKEPLYFAIDHCFPIRGQGKVMTGTVLSGSVEVGQTVEIPQLKEERKVKSMQMFRQPVQRAAKGDRVALCVSNLNDKLLERGVLTTPHSIPLTSAVIALVRKVKYFSLRCPSRSKVHITVGHSTTLGTVTFFGSPQLKEVAAKHAGKELPTLEFDDAAELEYDEELRGGGKPKGGPFLHWALIELDSPLICQDKSMIIGSRLDMDVDTKNCRIAFYGRVARQFAAPPTPTELQALKVFKWKQREAVVDRVADKSPAPDGTVHNVVARNMFSKDADLQRFLGKTLETAAGERGRLESAFGKTGKFNAYFPDGARLGRGDKLYLRFKHLLFASQDTNKRILQEL